MAGLGLVAGMAWAQRPIPPGLRPPRPFGGPPGARAERARPAADVPPGLNTDIPADAGSKDAPLLFCVGLHIEPFGAEISSLVPGRPDRPPRPRDAGDAADPMGGPKERGPRGRMSYLDPDVLRLHIAAIGRLDGMVRKHRGVMTVQAQTPFTRLCAEQGSTVLSDLKAAGHEIALHFHEQAHLGQICDRLPAGVWTDVMKEEIDWIRKACPSARVRYWSGGNNFPGLIAAAAGAGLDAMSDHKNPHVQKTFPELLAIHPWRPAGGPTETAIDEFARHDPAGRVVYLPDGIFADGDFRARKKEGDIAYLNAIAEGLVLSLRAARKDRVNVFHITVHPMELRDEDFGPWLERVIAPLVKAGKVKWATFSQMADAYRAWEKANPGADPRGAVAIAAPAAAARDGAGGKAGCITFAVNCHEQFHLDDSAETVLRLIGIFKKHGVRGDFYFTAPLAEAYAEKRPDVVKAVRESGMGISYHVRPPHPAYAGFGAPLDGLKGDALERALRDYETYRTDPATGKLQKDRPGGYALVKQLFGTAPVCVSSQAADPGVKTIQNRIYREMGAKMTLKYHESGTDPERPLQFADGLLVRPSDFSITRWKASDDGPEQFWWNRVAGRRPDAAFDPVARLDKELAAWKLPRPAYVTALIHENNFHFFGGAGWQSVYMEEGKRPKPPPWDLNAPQRARPRESAERTAIYNAYDALVAHAARTMKVVTSADLVALAGKP
jgi:hypothetical protein